MKRKRQESTTISNKILCLQNGSNVEVQLDDGKWHSGTIIQCQPRKYHVQVEQQQYWIDFDLIRPNTIIDQKKNVPFEYRPGQFLRKETKSTNKIVSEDKVSISPPPPPSSDSSPQIESSNDSKKKRLNRTTNSEQKKSPFVWKPSTISTIQTRRSSRSNHSPGITPEENFSNDRVNSTQQKSPTTPNSVKPPSNEVPSSEVLIFRPIIRFVESATNGQQSNNSTSPNRHSSTDDENPSKVHPNSKDDGYSESIANPDLIYHINASTDSRSSSTTSTDNPFIVNHYDTNSSAIDQHIKSEPKSSCFLETPPPSLPDIHVTQESEPSLDKPQHQQLKSKRKQDRPQRKQIQLKEQDEQMNGVCNHLELKQEKDYEDLHKISPDLCDPGYLSDEYGEPITSSNNDLETFSKYLQEINIETNDKKITEENKYLCQQLITYLYNNNENYDKIEKYRLEYYNNENNPHKHLISNILQQIFLIYYKNNSFYLSNIIPDEIKTQIKLCLNSLTDLKNKRIHTRGKRLTHFAFKNRQIKTNKKSTNQNLININENLLNNDQQQQQMLLSPASPLTPLATKLSEQQSSEDLLSPNNNNNILNSGVIEQISALPKERDIYEVINCLCHCQIDNGFMIQCETCLCWSHCECVGVTTTCIPASFKCSICTKAEAERTSQWSFLSILDDETTSLFLTTSNTSEKVSLFLSYSRRLWNLREQMIELKLRSTPILRSLQYALRCDDLVELYNSANMKSDQIMAKIEERRKNREFFESIAYTIDHIVDSVCSSISSSSCLSIELSKPERKSSVLTDQMDILISHLCDDDDTRQVRLSIQNRYEQLMSNVDNKIQTILLEHQSIQTQMAFELGIMPKDLSDECLSYDAHELALRTAIERLKS